MHSGSSRHTRMAAARAALIAALSLSLAGVAATPAHAGMWSWLRAPFAWLASTPPAPECTDDLCRELDLDQGWRMHEFELTDPGTGVYLEVQGRVQFRSAEIDIAGAPARMDLQYTTRSDGVFELKAFDGERRVRRVRVLARAVSPTATLAVRLSREAF